MLNILLLVLSTLSGFGESSDDDVGAVLVFSQPQYAPGDTAYFTGHLFTDKTGFDRRTLVSIVLIDSGNVEKLRERFWFENGVVFNRFTIPSGFKPGVYKLVLFIEYGTSQKIVPYSCDFPIAGELQFANDSPASDVDSLVAELKGLRQTYTTRELVDLEVKPFRNPDGDSILLSVSVYRKDLFRGKSVTYRLRRSTSVQLVDSLNLLRNLKYPSYFAGQIVDKRTGKPASDSLRVTFYLNSYDMIYSVVTSPNGIFKFPLFQNFTTQDIFYIISSRGTIIDNYRIVLVDPSASAGKFVKHVSAGSDEFTIYNRQRKVIHKSFSYFNSGGKGVSAQYTDSFEGDHEVRMDKYEPFSSMEEVILNVVPMVKVRKEANSYKVRMFLKDLQGYSEGDPVFIVDGMMTNNTDAVLAMDPRSVRKIVVLRSSKFLARFGDIGANGILVLETTDHSGTAINSGNTLRVQGVNTRIVQSKSAENPGARIPDLRHVLYYKPLFSADEATPIKFKTSDDTGVYVIELVGVTHKKGFLLRSEFKVVRPE